MRCADALLHLAGRLVGEGDGEDLAGPGLAGRQDMGEARGQHARLAGAGAGQHQQRAIDRLDRGALLGVQALEIGRLARGHGARDGAAGTKVRRGSIIEIANIDWSCGHQARFSQGQRPI